MTGRPSDYTEELALVICERIAEGESLRAICRDDDMPARSSVFKWLIEHKAFSDQYARAREAQADALFEDILEIADDKSQDVRVVGEDEREVCNTEFVQRARLRVDARKWMAGKLAPKKYGEKVIQEHTGANGGPIETRDVSDVGKLPREQRAAIRQALKGALDGASER